mgnify:CR=1 FL=1
MALKDWKKVGKNQWNSKFVNLSIEPLNDSHVKGWKYIINVYNFHDDKDIVSKMIKTEKQALSYAKSYMRTH